MNIVIISPGLEHDGNTPTQKSLGGSETAAIQLAEALVKNTDSFGRKNKVLVFSPCQKPVKVNDVQYFPIQAARMNAEGADIDLLIVSRALEALQTAHNAKVCYLWCHDLALRRFGGQFRGINYQVDRVLTMSQFQAKQYGEIYGIPKEGIEVIRNGIDTTLFPENRKAKDRERGLFVYGARPERGLENLVRPGGIMEKLLEFNKDIKLAVCHYDNTTKEMEGYYGALFNRCAELPNVRLVGSLNKQQLYDLYSRAWGYIYPTPGPISKDFCEISCISAQEAAACGTPFITCEVGALPETVVPGAGVLVKGDGYDERVQDTLVGEMLKLTQNELGWHRMSEAAYRHGMTLGWEPVATRLVGLADQIMAERTKNPVRLYKHFYRFSDIEMCREIEKVEGGEALAGAQNEIQSVASGWYFTENPALYRKHYTKVDEGASVSHYEQSENETRMEVVRKFCRENKGKYKAVLDYGCWIGHQAIRIANELPDAAVTGVDVTPRNIELAKECREKYAKHKNIDFAVWDEMGSEPMPGGPYDLIFCNEVLEHVLDPHEFIERMEKWCKPGGTIFLTVPYGPWEAQSYKTFPYRCHLRHYELADIQDVFGEKKNLQVFYKRTNGDNYGVPLGHHYIVYENDPTVPTGKVNVARKMKWQAPRETLAVCMIAYNAESMLHRCLKSVHDIADEIHVAIDPKTTDSTEEIARKYGATVFGGVNPIDVGFDEARNNSIKHTKADWILWIDSDEELLNPNRIVKYLRPNIMNAYGLQQHHLSVDPPMALKPDLPMRLFRNGKGMKFFGCLTPDTEVVTNPGVHAIKDICVGDYVKTHDGSYRKVTKKWSYDVEENLVNITAVGLPKKLELTGCHEVYAIRTKKCVYDNMYNVRCKSICTRTDCGHQYYEHYSPEWIRADQVKVGDLLMYPIDRDVIDVKTITLSKHAKQGKTKGKGSGNAWQLVDNRWNRGRLKFINDKPELTDGFLRLAGYYISDGHIGEKLKLSIVFGLNQNDYVEDVKNIAKSLGLESYVGVTEQAIVVTTACRPLCEWLIGEFGKGAWNKKAPLWIMRLPVEKQRQFLIGLWRGDGCVSGSLVRYTTVNRELAAQIQDLLLRDGVHANYQWGKAAKSYSVFARVKRRRFLDWDMPNDGPNVPNQIWSDSRYSYHRVKNVGRVPYTGIVMDLTVEGNHSYVANRAIVHNCVHEHPELGINQGVGPALVLSDTWIAHDGYLTEEVRRNRFLRNIDLVVRDRKKYPERTLGKFLWLRDLIHLCRYRFEQSGGQMDQQVAAWATEAKQLFESEYMGKPDDPMAEEAIAYYSEANQILGLGVPVKVNIIVNNNGGGRTINARFPDSTTAAKYIAGAMKAGVGMYEEKYI